MFYLVSPLMLRFNIHVCFDDGDPSGGNPTTGETTNTQPTTAGSANATNLADGTSDAGAGVSLGVVQGTVSANQTEPADQQVPSQPDTVPTYGTPAPTSYDPAGFLGYSGIPNTTTPNYTDVQTNYDNGITYQNPQSMADPSFSYSNDSAHTITEDITGFSDLKDHEISDDTT